MIILNLINLIVDLFLSVLMWLFSEKSAGILTVLTGLIAWRVYYLQVRSREKEVATVLLNEIRTAERAIDNIKGGSDLLNENVSILPTFSWEINYQVIARHLVRDHFDLLGSFFNSCKAAQEELIRLRSFLPVAMRKKAEIIQEKLLALSEKCKDQTVVIDGAINPTSEYAKEKEAILKIFHIEDYWFVPNKPKNDFLRYIGNIEKISGSIVMEKLRKIARE